MLNATVVAGERANERECKVVRGVCVILIASSFSEKRSCSCCFCCRRCLKLFAREFLLKFITFQLHTHTCNFLHECECVWVFVFLCVCVRGWWANLLNWMASNLRLPKMATETVVVTVEQLMALIQGSEHSIEGERGRGGLIVGVLIHKTYSALPACLERSNSASSCSCGCASEVAFNFGPRPRRRCCRTFWCCLPWWWCCCCWWWCCRRRSPCGRVSSSRRRSTMLACSEL